MSNTPHQLHEEFPQDADRIHELKITDPHFARLVEDYNDANRAVHAAESAVVPTDEAHETALRRQRLAVKDEIARRLAAS